jgi:hypothetical protein
MTDALKPVATVAQESFDGVLLIDWHADVSVGTRLYSHPIAVTDEMVDRARREYRIVGCMRAALTAALSGDADD